MIKSLRLELVTVFMVLGCGSASQAETAVCTIEFENHHTGEKWSATETLNYDNSKIAQDIWNINLPVGNYLCHFSFQGSQRGTMISCSWKDDGGNTYFQSDRTGIEERGKLNNLTFRHKGTFVIINSQCR